MKRSTGTPVNLLPLLDVLLCTMGTLIVVLGVLNRLARNHSVDAQREQLAIAKEQVTLRIEQLTTARQKTISDLDAARRRLSGIEDHSRQLADKLKTLSTAARQLAPDKTADDKRDALRRKLIQLNADRAKLDKDLLAAQRGSQTQADAFDCPVRRRLQNESATDLHRMPRRQHHLAAGRHRVYSPRFSGPLGSR